MTWTFTHDGKEVQLQRRAGEDGPLLVVTLTGKEPRVYDFADMAALAEFQRDMEHGLLLAGWRLTRFSPERRAGEERRRLARFGLARRRSLRGLLRPAVDIVGGHQPVRKAARRS